jgi:hypothetical protein
LIEHGLGQQRLMSMSFGLFAKEENFKVLNQPIANPLTICSINFEHKSDKGY